jgi:hypothetical protein
MPQRNAEEGDGTGLGEALATGSPATSGRNEDERKLISLSGIGISRGKMTA